jgi:hypothetical protein
MVERQFGMDQYFIGTIETVEKPVSVRLMENVHPAVLAGRNSEE